MKYFSLDELIAPEILAVLSEDAAWRLIPKPVQLALDSLRADYGAPLYINGWLDSKEFIYSGIRPKDCPIGASRSVHKMRADKMAFDLKCDDLDKLTKLVKGNFREYGIVRMEHPDYTRTWRHLEFGWDEPPITLDIFIP